jgi:N-glycosylase/DNA lyase
MINSISRCFGTKLAFDGFKFFTFPKSQDLSKASIKQLRNCGLGFRAKRVLETAKMIKGGDFVLERLKGLDYAKAKRELLVLPGVGNKVADCLLLFSLNKLEAFPIDVWMKRVVINLYSKHFDPSFIDKIAQKNSITDKEYKIIGSFGRKYFGKYAGYAQEYLFHQLRTQMH